jgi:ribose 5-phosphate isomerase RpiB
LRFQYVGKYRIADILTKSSQILVSGGAIYCTGGGFGSAIIASKVTEIITAGVSDGTCEVLENPHIINVSGMKYL